MVAEWEADLAAACKPVSATLPFWATYGVAPSSIITTVCSGTISLSGMLDYAALAVVFAVVTVAVPSMAADLVGGTIGLALAHAFEAAYTAQTVTKIVSPITAGLKKVSDGVASIANGRRDPVQNEPGAISNFVANGEHRNGTAPADAPTKVLNPFTGKPLPYDNGTGTTFGSGPALLSPNGGSGASSVPARPENPQRPGQYTKDIAVDVTDLERSSGQRS